MNQFLDKKDYYSYSLITIVVLTFYFSSKELTDSAIVGAAGAFLGAMIGVYIVYRVVHLSNKIKLLLNLAFGVVFVLCILLVTNLKALSPVSDEKHYFQGIWETSSTDGYSIKMRFNDQMAFMSVSPDYNEVGYYYTILNDSLILEKDNEVKFKLLIEDQESDYFQVLDQSGRLRFYKTKP